MTRNVLRGWFGELSAVDGTWAVAGPDDIRTSTGPVPLPGEAVLFLRMAVVAGHICLAGQGHQTGTCWIWDGWNWFDAGPTHGNSPAAWVAGQVVVCRSGNVAQRLALDGSVVSTLSLACGSQGIRWIRGDETIVTGDASYGDGRGLWEYTDYGDLSIGQIETGVGVRFADDNIVRVLEAGPQQMFVRVSRHGDRFGIAFRRTPTAEVVLISISAAELRALPAEGAPAPTPVPVPPVPVPPEVPVSHLDTVIAERAKYGTPLGYEGAWRVINAVALKHAAEGWGLVHKPTGTNWAGYSTDVVMNRVTGEAADILGSSETLGIPVWNVLSPEDTPEMSRWRPPVGTVEPVPVPPEPPPVPPAPPSDLEARVKRIEDWLAATFKAW